MNGLGEAYNLTVADVAEYLGEPEAAVCRLARCNAIPARKTTRGAYRFRAGDVRRYAESTLVPANPALAAAAQVRSGLLVRPTLGDGRTRVTRLTG